MHPLPVATRISAGGVVYRLNEQRTEVVLILVAPKGRWQLPKGTVNQDEANQQAALREVREETGIVAELKEEIERIEYWFYAMRGGKRVKFHKFVYFYLMTFLSGQVEDHDHEVEEARWFEIDEAIQVLAFDSEREVLRKAREKIFEASH